MPAQFASSTNTFVADHDATNKLVIDFSRSQSDFALNEYVQIVPVTKTRGLYLNMTIEQASRILNDDGEETYWADNSPAPEDTDGSESFEYLDYKTKRRKFGFRFGSLTVEQASWDIVAQHARIHMQRAMTLRTNLCLTNFVTSGNYAASHVSAAASIPGASGNWVQSTSTRQDIKRSLNHAALTIMKDTQSAVDPTQLMLVISPELAAQLSITQEIVDMIKQSPTAWAYVKGDLAKQNRNIGFGLPPDLYGYKLLVEKTSKVTSAKGATRASAFALAATTAFMCARPGDLEGLDGPSFSTQTLFMLEEATVEKKEDTDNRLVRGRIVENYAPVMTAPVSGFLFTAVS